MIKVLRYQSSLLRSIGVGGEVVDTVTDAGQLVNIIENNQSGALQYVVDGTETTLSAEEAISVLGGDPNILL
jgi:hypothetical protein